MLKQAEVEAVLQTEKVAANRACLMQVMEHFQLTCALTTASGPAWLVPTALSDTPPTAIEALRDAADAIRLRYTYQTVPEGLLTRLIVRRFDFIEEVREQRQLWKYGLVLLRKGARALICLDPLRRLLLITVSGPTKTRLQLADLCQAEMREIHAQFPDLDPLETGPRAGPLDSDGIKSRLSQGAGMERVP